VSASCIARGCPLRGSASNSTRGGGRWVCSAHRRAQPWTWPAVTARIRTHGWLFDLLGRCYEIGIMELSADDGLRVSAALTDRGLPSLAWRGHDEPLQEWVRRFEGSLIDLVVHGRVIGSTTSVSRAAA